MFNSQSFGSRILLIDALYINNSGGLRLLEYLVRYLNSRHIDFLLLADSRCLRKFDYCKRVMYMEASLLKRKNFYEIHKTSFSAVLCFGNIPAPIRLNAPVYTYFHNINLLTLSEAQSSYVKAKSWIKREVFKHYKENTDFWVVQTSNTANELIEHLEETSDRVKLIPFFELPSELLALYNISHGIDYVYISTYAPGKGHDELINSWRLLCQRGIDRKLHLTVPFDCPLMKRIEEAQSLGVNIVNHGTVPFGFIVDLYKQSKAIVYPSHNESLGLGLVEAIEAGCDVVASNLPFTHSICKPSMTFNPYSPESIADAVMRYEQSNCPKSELLIRNQIDELIQLLIDNH